MNLTRRSLFASAVALLALPRRVAAERLLGPVLVGDGVTDDTAALQAILDATGDLDGQRLTRWYAVSRPLIVSRPGVRIVGMRFVGIGKIAEPYGWSLDA